MQIANIRHNYLHQISADISKNQARVYVEDLKIKNMSKSSKGDINHPGKMVKQKSGLNRSILDQGWGELVRQLQCKLKWNGGQLVKVNPINTSRTCPVCLHISKDNRKSQSNFTCVQCGYTKHANWVGALNILRAGRAQLACEVNDAVRSSAAGTHRSVLAINYYAP